MTDKTDTTALPPALAREFITGTLKRIQQTQPDFFPYVMAQIHAQEPGFQLNGIFDSLSTIGDSMSSAIASAAQAYGGVLINRENAKTAAMVANDQAKSQIDVMNATLKAQQASTQNQFAQQQLALQQQQLLNVGSSFGGGLSSVSPIVWIIGGVAVLGMILMSQKRAA